MSNKCLESMQIHNDIEIIWQFKYIQTQASSNPFRITPKCGHFTSNSEMKGCSQEPHHMQVMKLVVRLQLSSLGVRPCFDPDVSATEIAGTSSCAGSGCSRCIFKIFCL